MSRRNWNAIEIMPNENDSRQVADLKDRLLNAVGWNHVLVGICIVLAFILFMLVCTRLWPQ